MIEFVIKNIKGLIAICSLVIAFILFCSVLYGIPPRVDKIEEDVRILQTKQEMQDLRFNNLEQSFADLKADMKEIKSDIKLLLRTK